MSYFLIYFEKNNAGTSWSEFNKKHDSIMETFSKVNEDKSLLSIENVRIKIDNKTIDAFIIYDGISSDRVLNTGLRNDPVVKTQCSVIGNFIENRLAIKAFEPWFIFHLYHNAIDELEVINYKGKIEAGVSDINDFSNNVKRDYLYKVLT